MWDGCVEFLPRCLASLRAQLPPEELRVLIVDNASAVPVADLGNADLLRLPRRVSVGLAQNAGLVVTETPYVVFVGADEEVFPGTFLFCLSRMESDERPVLCATGIVNVDSQGHELGVTWPSRRAYGLVRHRRLFALYNLWQGSTPIPTGTVIRTDDAREAGGFVDRNVGEDNILAAVLCFHGRVELHRRPGRRYLVRPGSLWHRPQPRDVFVSGVKIKCACLRRSSRVPRWLKALLPLIEPLLIRKATRSFFSAEDELYDPYEAKIRRRLQERVSLAESAADLSPASPEARRHRTDGE